MDQPAELDDLGDPNMNVADNVNFGRIFGPRTSDFGEIEQVRYRYAFSSDLRRPDGSPSCQRGLRFSRNAPDTFLKVAVANACARYSREMASSVRVPCCRDVLKSGANCLRALCGEVHGGSRTVVDFHGGCGFGDEPH